VDKGGRLQRRRDKERIEMIGQVGWLRWVGVAVLACGSASVWAQTSVTFGRITAVRMVSESDARAQVGGAIVGGAIGAAAGSGRSGSNRALGGIGGAVAGQQIGRLASQRQLFEYTILLDGTQTVTMVSDQAGKRVGDCVAVERGTFNNLRLVADAKCSPSPVRAAPATVPRAPAPPKPTPADVGAANACIQAKEQLLAAESDDAFDRAERRVRLLCGE
jgi:outer membrane lipoprotein SlyB